MEAVQAKHNHVAVSEFREILRLDPQSAEAHANLGVIAYTQKEYAQAAEEFRAALKLRPSLWNAQAFLGMSELRLGRLQEAKPHLEESFRHVQDAKLQSQVGSDLISLYYQTHELDPAVDLLRTLQRQHPNEPDLLYTAYRTYTELAVRALATLGQAAPESAQMHRILAGPAEPGRFLGRCHAIPQGVGARPLTSRPALGTGAGYPGQLDGRARPPGS